MPDLMSSLQGNDLGHLRIIAEHWGLDLNAPDAHVGLQRLVAQILQQDLIVEVIDTLPEQARVALDDLLANTGRLPWALFTRRYGKIHKIGAGRRDRLRPDLSLDVTPAEILWYRGLIANGTFDAPDGPLDFAYIPDDLVEFIPSPKNTSIELIGRLASPNESTFILPANDIILDDTCTLLAALRMGSQPESVLKNYSLTGAHLEAMLALLKSANILTAENQPISETTRQFLEIHRGEALTLLINSWLNSPICNDLRLVPGLISEGEWQNDPLRTRQVLTGFLTKLPAGKWWSLNAFISVIHQKYPDFQRPTGEYESWYIRNAESGEYLRGFEHWFDVEGALLRYLITGPLHWLNFMDLAAQNPGTPPTAFRITPWGDALLHGKIPPGIQESITTVVINTDAHLRISRLTPRAVRYQLARFSAWEGGVVSETYGEAIYNYRLTPTSLANAIQQGLTMKQLLALLRKYCQVVPPILIKALERWENNGTQARLEHAMILRVSSPEILKVLQKSRAARFLGDILGPTTIIIQPLAGDKVLSILAEIGYLGEIVSID